MTSALEGVGGQQHAPTALYSRERPGTHCTGGISLHAFLLEKQTFSTADYEVVKDDMMCEE
jgi:hypothetical protein